MTIQNHTFQLEGTPRISRFESLPPEKVTNVSFFGSTTSSITISWTLVSNADTYKVYVDSIITLNGITGNSATITGLTSDTAYQIQVSGVNSNGEGQKSDKTTMVTDSSVVIATRDRQLHPFPEDDPYNMPLGANVWYASTTDPATSDVRNRGGSMAVNNGWSHPIYFPLSSDPIHEFRHSSWGDCDWRSCKVESYLNTEDLTCCIYERLPSGADVSSAGEPGYWDAHLHMMVGNDLVETYQFERTSATTALVGRCVRNRLDHYCYSYYAFPNDLLANTAGTRAWGGVSIAGLIRKHEVETDDPYIPHALAVGLNYNPSDPTNKAQLGYTGMGNPESPLYNVKRVFPATTQDGPTNNNTIPYEGSTGSCRMGMRFAMDPTIVTDTYLAGIENKWTRAVIRALRDYGMIVADTAGQGVLYGEEGISTNYNGVNIERSLQDWAGVFGTTGPDGLRMILHLRRVAGAGPNHTPSYSVWQSWANNKEGWGGGTPRVPYSAPLAPL